MDTLGGSDESPEESYLCLKQGCEKRFGTQRGMKTHVSKSHDPTQYMLADINFLGARLGRKPSKREYNDAGLWNARSVADQFGSFNEAIALAGFEPTPANSGTTGNSRATYSDEAVLETVREIVDDLGRFPKISEFDGQTEMTSKTVFHRFGDDDDGWYETLEAMVGPHPRSQHARDQYGHVAQNEAKARARSRDEHVCRVCGAEPDYDGWDVHPVHHITPLAICEDTEEAIALNNLITLCASCHDSFEWKWIDCNVDQFARKAQEAISDE